jgi:hypothetical protein
MCAWADEACPPYNHDAASSGELNAKRLNEIQPINKKYSAMCDIEQKQNIGAARITFDALSSP